MHRVDTVLLACFLAVPRPPSIEAIAEFGSSLLELGARFFGDYEILGEIARGGMGIVYRAKQLSLNREVALKMIAAGPLIGRGFIERFHVEAEAAARLHHPNIVPIYEVGEYRGQHFLSMKLIEGKDLAKRISNAAFQMSDREAAHFIVTVARAVHHAHQHGILTAISSREIFCSMLPARRTSPILVLPRSSNTTAGSLKPAPYSARPRIWHRSRPRRK